MRRYGMRFRTIRYWQAQAKNLRRMRGYIPFISMRAYYTSHYMTMDARAIASYAIQFAMVGESIESL